MTLAVIPLLFFSALVVFSNPSGERPPDRKLNQHEQSTAQMKQKSDAENFNTIYTYILNKYKTISKEDAERITEHLISFGNEHDLDPKLAAALIERESSFNKHAVSSTGAKGLGQIKDFNYDDLNINDPFDIKENVNGTVKYLKTMIKQWKEKDREELKRVDTESSSKSDVQLALASYYKGFTAVKTQGVDAKTQAYVDDIIKSYQEISESSE